MGVAGHDPKVQRDRQRHAATNAKAFDGADGVAADAEEASATLSATISGRKGSGGRTERMRNMDMWMTLLRKR